MPTKNDGVAHNQSNLPQKGGVFSSIWERIKVALIALINIIFLLAFAAYFQGQTISLSEVFEIISNGVGIITGLLGIWFFFQSEELNRNTASNLERTTSVVTDLREQMWSMIQQTFNKFVVNENQKTIEEARSAIDILRDQLRSQDNSSQIQIDQAIETLSKKIENIERQTSIINPAISSTNNGFSSTTEFDPDDAMIAIAIEYTNKFPVKARDIASSLRQHLKISTGGPDIIAKLISEGILEFDQPLLDPDISRVKGDQMMKPGPKLRFALNPRAKISS